MCWKVSCTVAKESARQGNSSGVRRAAATRPGLARKGGLFLAMFQIPNKFFERDGRETDFLGNDWKKSWSHALGK